MSKGKFWGNILKAAFWDTSEQIAEHRGVSAVIWLFVMVLSLFFQWTFWGSALPEDTLKIVLSAIAASAVLFVPAFFYNVASIVYMRHGADLDALDIACSDPMIVPEPGWSYFHWDDTVYQESGLVLWNRGGGDAKDILISDMSNAFGKATFRVVGFIARNDWASITPDVENYDSAPIIKQRDLAHLVDAEFNPIGQKEGSIKISIDYRDVNNNRFITTGRLVRERTNSPHQFKDLKFRRVK